MQRRNTKGRMLRGNYHIDTIPKRSLSKKVLDAEYIKYCIKVNHDPQFVKSKEKDRNRMLKRCMECQDFINGQYMLYCMYCLDAYHSYCLSPQVRKIPANRECIVCPHCKEEQNKNKLTQLTMDVFTRKVKSKSKDKGKYNKCAKCRRDMTNKEDIQQCEKCKGDFHSRCFGNTENEKIICDECEKKITVALRATKISDYFKSTKLLGNKRAKSKDKINDMIQKDFDIYQTISQKLSTEASSIPSGSSHDGHIKLPKNLNKKTKERMMTSLFRALQVKGITFNDDLVYMDPDCPAKMNNSLLETGINEISPYNKKIYYSFKERSRKGEYAPVEVIDDPIQRFIVKAIDDIQMNTIICEYTGEVTLLRKKIFDKNDSIMELIRTPSSNTSLVICPENYGNLARFLSGVNNYDSKLKRKQNVYSIRLSIDGTVHILLLALRNIKKGEVLYYDYNAGGYDEYPTEHFV